VLVLPSLREATGSVIIEGMARGLPVITISGFGGAQIVSEETGWLYSGNTKEEYIKALKDAIVECLESPDEVKRKGENALKAAENYTFEKRARYYQNIYES
jgi:glycosyltransferase involved in cell wall biosynthesis